MEQSEDQALAAAIAASLRDCPEAKADQQSLPPPKPPSSQEEEDKALAEAIAASLQEPHSRTVSQSVTVHQHRLALIFTGL